MLSTAEFIRSPRFDVFPVEPGKANQYHALHPPAIRCGFLLSGLRRKIPYHGGLLLDRIRVIYRHDSVGTLEIISKISKLVIVLLALALVQLANTAVAFTVPFGVVRLAGFRVAQFLGGTTFGHSLPPASELYLVILQVPLHLGQASFSRAGTALGLETEHRLFVLDNLIHGRIFCQVDVAVLQMMFFAKLNAVGVA